MIELIDVPVPAPVGPVRSIARWSRRRRCRWRPRVPRLPHTETPALEVAGDDITIGDVTLSHSLWSILCDEADQHLATLRHECGVLQFDSHAVPSASMIRAGHTLCGIHRTGGLPLVAATAKSLEQALIALEQRGAPMPGHAHPVLARATAALAMFVTRVKARAPFTAR